MAATSKHLIYTHTAPPAQYHPGWLANEFGSVQRALQQVATGAAALKLVAGTNPDNYPLDAVDAIVVVDATANGYHVDLPVATKASGVTITVKKIDGTANPVIVVVTGGGTIDGLVSVSMSAQYKSATCRSDGNVWWQIAST